MPEELAFRERRLEKIREAMAALEAEAWRLPNRPRQGGKPRGCPTTRPSVTSPIPSRASSPHLEERTSCKRTTVRRWWTAHQVIVAARATNQTSDKQQAAAMIEETIDNVGAVPREVSADAGYYSAKAVDELYALGVDPFVAPEQTRHGRVPAPRGRIPSHLSPGTRRKFRPSICGCKLWSRYSARSSRAGDSGSSCCGERPLHRPQPCSALGSICTRWASPTHQELCRGSEQFISAFK